MSVSAVPQVSVHVMVFNSEPFLASCLQSLARQSHDAFEVLMVDAGSTDRSAEICRRFAETDERFRYFSIPACRVAVARQFALEVSRGELIAVLDSDDWSYPDRLVVQARTMASMPDHVLVAGYYRVVNRWGFPLRVKPIHFTDDIEIRWRLTFGNCLTHSTVMYRKKAAVSAGGYGTHVRAGEDIEFYSRMLAQGRFGVIPHRLSASRVHAASLSQTEPREWEQDFITSVQQSVRLQTGAQPAPEVAEAIYNQSARPAASLDTFLAALSLVRLGRSAFEPQTRTPRERRLLGRAIFLHLLQLMTKNGEQRWWSAAEPQWLQTVRDLCRDPAFYTWARDKGLIFQLKHILKTSTRAVWVLGKDFYVRH